MMLQQLLQPIPQHLIEANHALAKFQLGKHLHLHHTEAFPDLTACPIALIGLDDSMNLIRPYLYQFSYPFRRLRIADLGNVKNANPEMVTPILKELLLGGTLPLIIGSDVQLTIEQSNAHQALNPLNNLVLIDERFHFTTDKRRKRSFWLNKILNEHEPSIFNLGIIGYQAHLIDHRVLTFFEDAFFDPLRLGILRSSPEEAEPILRDADLVSLHLPALKRTEAPACPESTPSGLTVEETCQLMHYAGMSDKLTSIGIYGYQPDADSNQQTAQVVAQLIWYFLNGFYNRKQDYPVSMGNFVEYIVDFKENHYQITFWKSTRSDRWWMEVPTSNKQHRRHRLIPCSYSDYLQACREELPERLLHAYNRFS